MLTQLVYTSRPRFNVAGPEGRQTLEDIAGAARKRNAEAGVSGVLVAAGDQLLQVLEGNSTDLSPILGRILADERHEGVQIVEMRKIPARRFDGWALGVGTRPITDIPANRLADMTADELVKLAGISIA